MMTPTEAAHLVKQRAAALGFAACGIAEAGPVPACVTGGIRQWVDDGCAAGMDYMRRHADLRADPRLLVPGARSLIVTALNYFPGREVRPRLRFAYYAYGADYHHVIRSLLSKLFDYIRADIAPALMPDTLLEGRPFTDSAPIVEHYWAVQAGVGFLGRNRLIIVPRCGSYCFLGTLVLNLPLPADRPLRITCGRCRRCLDACPTGALQPCGDGYRVDARRCISYQTIENRTEDIPAAVADHMEGRIYGCDACQEACPWNRFATPTRVAEFQPTAAFLALDGDGLRALGSSGFRRLFARSAVCRAGYKGLLRNLRYASPQNPGDERQRADETGHA